METYCVIYKVGSEYFVYCRGEFLASESENIVVMPVRGRYKKQLPSLAQLLFEFCRISDFRFPPLRKLGLSCLGILRGVEW